MGVEQERKLNGNDLKKQIANTLKEIGDAWRRGEFGLNGRSQRVEEVLANIPSEIEEWLQQKVKTPSGKEASRLLYFLGGGTFDELERPSISSIAAYQRRKPSRGWAKHIRREKAMERRRDLSWLRPSSP